MTIYECKLLVYSFYLHSKRARMITKQCRKGGFEQRNGEIFTRRYHDSMVGRRYEESRKCGMQENLHARVARACSPWHATMPTLIIRDSPAPLLACKLRKSRFYGCIEPRCNEKDANKMEGVKDGGKKKRKGKKWSGITRKSAKVRRMVGERKWRKKKWWNLRDWWSRAWWSFSSLPIRQFGTFCIYTRG